MQRGVVALLVDPITVFLCQLVVMHEVQVYPVGYKKTLIQQLQRNALMLDADNNLHCKEENYKADYAATHVCSMELHATSGSNLFIQLFCRSIMPVLMQST